MKIFTTINPNGNFDAQNEAMSSWASKFNIYSVNTKQEINTIEDLYPYVNFIESENTFDFDITKFRTPPLTALNIKKRLVKLNAILDSINKTDGKHFCIVNSDIILKSDKLSNLFLDKYLSDGLIISTRYELEGDKITKPFSSGYDVFIFDKKNINMLYNDNYVIGMPWWDYWVPIISLKNLKLYHIDEKVFLHRTHKTNYNFGYWVRFGEFLYNDIIVNIMNATSDMELYDFCDIIKKHIEKKQINIKL
jgi:hypothetical protein